MTRWEIYQDKTVTDRGVCRAYGRVVTTVRERRSGRMKQWIDGELVRFVPVHGRVIHEKPPTPQRQVYLHQPFELCEKGCDDTLLVLVPGTPPEAHIVCHECYEGYEYGPGEAPGAVIDAVLAASWLGEVMEHAPDLPAALRRLRRGDV